MPVSFPLDVSQFFDDLPVQNISFRLQDDSSFSRTGNGEVIKHNRGARLWTGRVELDIDEHAFWAGVDARLALLEEPGASFLIWDIRLPGLVADPDLSILGSATPALAAIGSNRHEISISGLPVGYRISRGDVLGFQYGANPTRYAYHKVAFGSVAGGAGTAAGVTVVPAIRPGASLGTLINLRAPVLKATLQNPEYGASSATLSEGGSFRWLQTLG